MRKLTLIAGLAVTAFAFSAFVTPKAATDNNFEGIVTFTMTVDNPQYASMMQGNSIKVYIKGSKSKTVADMGMYKRITFMDRNSADDPVTLVEAMGNKYELKNDKTKKDDKQPDIKYMDDTKQIAGYTCHKAEVTFTDEQGQKITTDLYYTEDIMSGPSKSGTFKGLKGFPMEYSIKAQGMNMSFTATKVDKQSVSDDTFKVPSGYKLMTQEEMQQDMMKSQGGN